MYQTHFHLPWFMSRFVTQCDDTLPSTLEGRITNLVINDESKKALFTRYCCGNGPDQD